MPQKTYSTPLIKNARNLRQNMPPAERRLWFDGIPTLQHKFRRQRPVGRYVVDFYCASAQLIVELGGATHDNDAAQTYDALRTSYLSQVGMHVVRFTNDEVMRNLEGVMYEIARVLDVRLRALGRG
jgi:very-short-patch-repair endonuclease